MRAESWNSLLLWRERLRETLRALSAPLPPDLTSLACLPAPVYIDYYHYCCLQYNTSPPPQHPYPSHPSLDSSLLPVPSAEPATTTPNGPSASDEPGLNHDPRGPPPLCCAAVLLLSSLLLLCCCAAVDLPSPPSAPPRRQLDPDAAWPAVPLQLPAAHLPQPNTSPDPSSVCLSSCRVQPCLLDFTLRRGLHCIAPTDSGHVPRSGCLRLCCERVG